LHAAEFLKFGEARGLMVSNADYTGDGLAVKEVRALCVLRDAGCAGSSG